MHIFCSIRRPKATGCPEITGARCNAVIYGREVMALFLGRTKEEYAGRVGQPPSSSKDLLVRKQQAGSTQCLEEEIRPRTLSLHHVQQHLQA